MLDLASGELWSGASEKGEGEWMRNGLIKSAESFLAEHPEGFVSVSALCRSRMGV